MAWIAMLALLIGAMVTLSMLLQERSFRRSLAEPEGRWSAAFFSPACDRAVPR